MSRKQLFLCIPTFVAMAVLCAVTVHGQTPSYVSSHFTVETATEIPGHILKPGPYSVSIVDHMKDRFIVEVDDSKGKTQATFIGLHNPEFAVLTTLHQQGAIFWTASPRGTKAVRAFSFPNGNTVEFVYPKAEAVALAKLNTNSVPAIDPESEGIKPDPKLSPEDRQIVTLWMLTATRVGPKNETPAIEAKRFEAPAEPAAPVQEARVAPSPVPGGGEIAAKEPPAGVAIAPHQRTAGSHPAMKRLPQTASGVPVILLISLLLLGTADGIVQRRRAS